MSSQPIPPIIPPAGDDRSEETKIEGDELLEGESLPGDSDDRPLDPDLDEDRQSSVEADERAATQGTLDGDSPT